MSAHKECYSSLLCTHGVDCTTIIISQSMNDILYYWTADPNAYEDLSGWLGFIKALIMELIDISHFLLAVFQSEVKYTDRVIVSWTIFSSTSCWKLKKILTGNWNKGKNSNGCQDIEKFGQSLSDQEQYMFLRGQLCIVMMFSNVHTTPKAKAEILLCSSERCNPQYP